MPRPSGTTGIGKYMTQLVNLEVGDSIYMPAKVTDGAIIASSKAVIYKSLSKLGYKAKFQIEGKKVKVTRVE